MADEQKQSLLDNAAFMKKLLSLVRRRQVVQRQLDEMLVLLAKEEDQINKRLRDGVSR